MYKIEKMLLGNGLIIRSPDKGRMYVERGAFKDSFVVKTPDGSIVYRIEKSLANDADLVVRRKDNSVVMWLPGMAVALA